MTLQEIKDEIARIACMTYNGARAEDMKAELDALWEKINESTKVKTESEKLSLYEEVNRKICEIPQTDVEDFIDEIQNQLFTELTFVDEKIDDGCDDEEDTYVMMRSFDFEYRGEKFYIRIFYGNNTYKVGCFDLHIR